MYIWPQRLAGASGKVWRAIHCLLYIGLFCVLKKSHLLCRLRKHFSGLDYWLEISVFLVFRGEESLALQGEGGTNKKQKHKIKAIEDVKVYHYMYIHFRQSWTTLPTHGVMFRVGVFLGFFTQCFPWRQEMLLSLLYGQSFSVTVGGAYIVSEVNYVSFGVYWSLEILTPAWGFLLQGFLYYVLCASFYQW